METKSEKWARMTAMTGNGKKGNIRKAWGLPKYEGFVRIHKVNCKKPNCRSCPHAYYIGLRKKIWWSSKEKYIGRCDSEGMPIKKEGILSWEAMQADWNKTGQYFKMSEIKKR